MKTKEVFRDVKNYEGLYQVSNLGRVKSLKFNKEKILKTSISTSGYFVLSLSKNKKQKVKQVHQLVAESFLGHISNRFKLVVNHINFNKLDNRADNLEIVTNRENSNLKHIKSSSQFTGVSWNKSTKKWMASILINGRRKHLGYFINELDASNAYQKAIKEL